MTKDKPKHWTNIRVSEETKDLLYEVKDNNNLRSTDKTVKTLVELQARNIEEMKVKQAIDDYIRHLHLSDRLKTNLRAFLTTTYNKQSIPSHILESLKPNEEGR